MADLSPSTPAPGPDQNPLRQDSEAQRRKLRRRGTLLIWLASPFLVPTIALFLVAMLFPLTWEQSRFVLVVALVLLIVWLMIYKRGKRYKALSATEVTENDPRPPVVYLRSFQDDRRAGKPLYLFRAGNARMTFHYFAAWSEMFHIFDGISEEEVLADVVSRVGPMIAIGRPGENLPQLGAARVYVTNEEWQREVHAFLDKASLVVLRLGRTEGFWWEVEQSAKKLDPRRLVLLVPLNRKDYEEFRTRASKYFPHGLPDYHSSPFRRLFGPRLLGYVRGLIYFQPDWTPVYVDFWRVKLPFKYTLRFLGRRKIVNVYDMALLPVYEQLGIKWEPPRYRKRALAFNFAPWGLWILRSLVPLGIVVYLYFFPTPKSLADEADQYFKMGAFADAKPPAERACNGGNMHGCTILGYLYEHGLGVAQDYNQARSLFQKACDGGDMIACSNLGGLYGDGKGVPRDYAQARSLYQKACGGGDMAGCNNLGDLYVNGEGVARDYTQARVLFQKACNGGEMMGCYNLGWLYANGRGVPQDNAQARSLYQKACSGGLPLACNDLKTLPKEHT
jgi:uncharacterized protein